MVWLLKSEWYDNLRTFILFYHISTEKDNQAAELFSVLCGKKEFPALTRVGWYCLRSGDILFDIPRAYCYD